MIIKTKEYLNLVKKARENFENEFNKGYTEEDITNGYKFDELPLNLLKILTINHLNYNPEVDFSNIEFNERGQATMKSIEKAYRIKR